MGVPVIQRVLRDGCRMLAASGALTPRTASVARLLCACRTGELGYTVYRCPKDDGHPRAVRPNSCGDRHCRTCAACRIEKRLHHEREHLLDSKHHHLVFTLPPALRLFFRFNRKLVGSILMRSSSTSVLRVLENPRYLGGTAGIVSFLHTWNQRMEVHPHVHLVVSGAGVTKDGQLVTAKLERLLPHQLVSAHWRATFINMLRAALRHRRGDVKYPDGMDERALRVLLVRLSKTYWHVRTSPGLRSKHAIKYNVAYSIGGCIGNSRVASYDSHNVVIRSRTRRAAREQHGPSEHLTLSRDEFIKRYLSHVAEPHERTIGHYGLYMRAATNRGLARARALLRMQPVLRSKPQVRDLADVIKHAAPARCSACGAQLYPGERLTTGPPAA